MDRKDGCFSRGGSFVNAPFTSELVKTQAGDYFVKGFVSYATGLFHAIKAFCKVPYSRFFA